MAKVPPQDKFLGGFAFNQAGAGSPDNDPAAEDTGPIVLPSRVSRQGLRTLIVIGVILLLSAVLYVVSDYGLGGVTHVQGRGVAPEDKPSVPTKNF